MSFKFMSNRIDTRTSVPTLSELLKQANAKKALASKQNSQTKTASKKAKSKLAEKEESKSSGQPEVEAELVNEPTKDEPKSVGADTNDSSCHEGDSSGQLDVEPLHQNSDEKTEKKDKSEKKETEAKSDAGVKTAKFVRIAKLTDKQKDFLRKSWSLYWPESFIEAILNTD